MLNFLTSTGMTETIVMLVAMLGIFYFMLIRPENKRKKEADEMRSSIRTGDEIVTIGGIVGTVVDVKEKKIIIETSADRVRIELEKWGVSSNATAEARAKEEAKAKEKAKATKKAAK